MKPYLKGTRTTSSNTPLTYASAYGWTDGQVKTNSCIFICSFGGNINGRRTKVGNKTFLVTNSDYHTYCKSIGVQPSALYLYVEPNAITNAQDEYIENVLDCSMCCMNQCTIVLSIFPQTYDFYDCFQKMLAGYTINGTLVKPTQISISWGCSESYASVNDQTLLPGLIQRSGIPVFSASGDYNATNGTEELMVDHPSCCPYIIGVGGTTIVSMKPFKEKVWNSNGYGTGGGYSQLFTKPSYQTCDGERRAIPDITAVADPETGVKLCIYGRISGGYGGTSMAAPFVCSLYAICQYRYRIKDPVYSLLYKSTGFQDITVGNNIDDGLGYNATIGYDACSGLGSIQWNKFVLPLRPTLFLNIKLNQRYKFPYPIQFKSSVLMIRRNSILATKVGNYIISNFSMIVNITVLR